MEILNSLQPKDSFALLFSCLALIVSIISFVVTLLQKKGETERGLRLELSNVLEKLSDIEVVMAQDGPGHLGGDLPAQSNRTIRGVKTIQRRYLTSKADFIVKRVPAALVTDGELLVLALAYAAIDDFSKAEEYWRKCIDTAVTPLHKAVNLRMFARFCFFVKSAEEGRRQFASAVELASDATDASKYSKGTTYEVWAAAEAQAGFHDEAENKLKIAKVIFESISWRLLRNRGLEQFAQTERVLAKSRDGVVEVAKS